MTDAKSNVFEEDLMNLIFFGSSIAGFAENVSTAPVTSFSIQLHTSDPGEACNCATAEVSYGGYARVAVERTSSGWTLTTPNSIAPTTNILFPQCTSGTATAAYFSVGNSTTAASTGKVLYYGPLTPNISIATGIIPRISTATAITES